MGKILLTGIVILLALFIIYSKDISIILKFILIICLIITEVLVIAVL